MITAEVPSSVEATLQVHGKYSFVGGTLCSNRGERLERKE